MSQIALVFLLAATFFRQSGPSPDRAGMRQEAEATAKKYRDEAIRLNEIAGHIGTEADARALVDSVAEMFAKELPPEWVTTTLRARLAHAEFRAVSSGQLISEAHVADVWNEYVREIGASSEAAITAGEIHYLRDASYASGSAMWKRGWNQSVWTMPAIYAVGPDGKVAGGCRPLEVLRVLHDVEALFENVRNARLQMAKGIVASDEIKKTEDAMNRGTVKYRAELRSEVRTIDNPVRTAELRYIQEHGTTGMNLLVLRLFDELFPSNWHTLPARSLHCSRAGAGFLHRKRRSRQDDDLVCLCRQPRRGDTRSRALTIYRSGAFTVRCV